MGLYDAPKLVNVVFYLNNLIHRCFNVKYTENEVVTYFKDP